MNRSLVAALALCGVAAASASAVAAPTLGFRLFQDGVLLGAASTSSSTGVLSNTTTTSRFSVVTALAFGAPIIAAPALDAQTTAISSLSTFGSGSSTLRLEFTQTDVPSASAGGLFARLANTLSANLLINGNLISGVTISNYADAANGQFATTTLLATSTFTAPGANASPIIIGNASLPNSLFSETIVFSVTFLGAGATLNASSQIVAVPEPATIGLFGMALLGLGMLRRRENV